MADSPEWFEGVEDSPRTPSDVPEIAVHNIPTESNSSGIAERDFALNFEDGLIPVEDGDSRAPVAPRTVHFEPNLNDEESPIEKNLRRLLEPPTFHKFAMPPDPESLAARPWMARLISTEETEAEKTQAASELKHSMFSTPSAAQKIPKALAQDKKDVRASSKVTWLPAPNQGQLQGHQGVEEAFVAYQPSVKCTFGLMKDGFHSEPSLSFVTEEFEVMEESDDEYFPRRLALQAEISTGLVFLVITNWQAWFLPHLLEAIPSFPVDTVLHLHRTSATTMLPLVDVESGEISCVMEHVDVGTEGQGFNVGTTKAQCLPLVVWTSAMNGLSTANNRPLAVVISVSTGNISSKISKHYLQQQQERWNRLSNNQIWIYLDLYFLFTRWDRIWGAMKQNLNARIEEIHSRRNTISIIEHTRQLHTDNNDMISLREHLRIHQASLDVVMKRAQDWPEPSGPRAGHSLLTRLDDAFRLLNYYDVTASTLLEQQGNLLSLTFNLETAIQGQAVARLNALAFVFLPLSFVATVFGITTFTAPARWYPVAAAPVLMATVAIAWIANKIFASEASPKSHKSALQDLETSTTDATLPTKTPSRSLTTWRGLRGRKKSFTQLFSPSDSAAHLAQPSLSLNDPSRISKPVRSATLDSLEVAGFAPPRSTAPFILRSFTNHGEPVSNRMEVPSSNIARIRPDAPAQFHRPQAGALPYPVTPEQDVAVPYRTGQAGNQPPVPPALPEDSRLLAISLTERILQLGRELDSSNGRVLAEGDGTSTAEITGYQQPAAAPEATINVHNESPLDQLVSSLTTSAAAGTEQQPPERNDTLPIIAEENEESVTST
ncbi:hypothetical protein IFR05_006033 [Cadophora sp. M221]|nr:hypothetical protein IFR05_006033 [Cadophora sp. M221]